MHEVIWSDLTELMQNIWFDLIDLMQKICFDFLLLPVSDI
mgnify:CR=1 FL=1